MLGDMLRPQPSVCRYAECQYPEWHYAGVFRLTVNILGVMMALWNSSFLVLKNWPRKSWVRRRDDRSRKPARPLARTRRGWRRRRGSSRSDGAQVRAESRRRSCDAFRKDLFPFSAVAAVSGDVEDGRFVVRRLCVVVAVHADGGVAVVRHERGNAGTNVFFLILKQRTKWNNTSLWIQRNSISLWIQRNSKSLWKQWNNKSVRKYKEEHISIKILKNLLVGSPGKVNRTFSLGLKIM